MSPLLKPLHYVAGLALPPRCPGCAAVLGEQHLFCPACFAQLRFLAPPWCAACHVPFEYDRGEGALCGGCLADPPRHAGVRAAVAYGDIARTVALRLKYGGRMGFAETAARAMARLVPEDADLFVPVPLHRWRLWSRGFNQAALIATRLSARQSVPADLTVLQRARPTPPLRGLGAKARARAVAGVFRVAAPERVCGKAVVLVDDVHTSGATSDGCTATLLRAGAAKVTILCWARVLDESHGN